MNFHISRFTKKQKKLAEITFLINKPNELFICNLRVDVAVGLTNYCTLF